MDNKQRLKTLFECYQRMITDPAFEDFGHTDYARLLKVDRTTIYAWDKRVDWDSVLSERRKNYAQKTAKIDTCLYKMAQKDKGAAQLWYERFDGYVPTSATMEINAKPDDELKRRADAIKIELLAQQGARPNQPGTGEATA